MTNYAIIEYNDNHMSTLINLKSIKKIQIGPDPESQYFRGSWDKEQFVQNICSILNVCLYLIY